MSLPKKGYNFPWTVEGSELLTTSSTTAVNEQAGIIFTLKNPPDGRMKSFSLAEAKAVFAELKKHGGDPLLLELLKTYRKILEQEEQPKDKSKVSLFFLDYVSTTEDTLKKQARQIDKFTKIRGELQGIAERKNSLTNAKGEFLGVTLSVQEDRAIKGIYSLLQKRGASEERPFIILNTKAELYEEILEKTRIDNKDGKTYQAFSGSATAEIDSAIKRLAEERHTISLKGIDGKDKKGRPTYFHYLAKAPILSVEFLKTNIPENEIAGTSAHKTEKTGFVKISIHPIFLKNYDNYFAMIPKDIPKEIRSACPEITKTTPLMIAFINYLHRQKNIELRRARATMIRVLNIEKQYKKDKTRTTNSLVGCYEIAKRAGYLTEYKLDQQGKHGLVDVLLLNSARFEHTLGKKKGVSDE